MSFPPRHIGLRTTLLGLLAGSTALAMAAVASVALEETHVVLNDLGKDHFKTISIGVASAVESELQRIPDAFHQERLLASVSDGLDIKLRLKEQLTAMALLLEPGAVIGYGDHRINLYARARRLPKGLVEVDEAFPNAFGEEVMEEDVVSEGSVDKSFEPPQAIDTEYEKTDWFKRGLRTQSLAWTRPRQIESGVTGISAFVPFIPDEAEGPVGVFHIDIPLDDIERWLTNVQLGSGGRVFIIDDRGEVLLGPIGDDIATVDAQAVINASIPGLTHGLGKLRVGAFMDNRVIKGDDTYYTGFYDLSFHGGLNWNIAVIAPEDDFLHLAEERIAWIAGIALVLVLIVAAVSLWIANRIARPIVGITGDIEHIGLMEFTEREPPQSIVREITVLGQSVERMKSGLRSMERYIPSEVARGLVAKGDEAKLSVERREIGIFFSDIEGFTGIAERMDPINLVDELREYFDAMTEEIERNGGAIDKFIGDAVMALFNAPVMRESFARDLCNAAIDCQIRLEQLRGEWMSEGRVPLRMRIGLGLGDVLVGNIGSTHRFGYTVVGDPVNIAARFEGVNKTFGTQILGSQTLRERAGDGFEWRVLDWIIVTGRTGASTACELLGRKGEVPADTLALRDAYEAALGLYRHRSFDEAVAAFETILSRWPEDKASVAMAERARLLLANPPGPEWDGVYAMQHK